MRKNVKECERHLSASLLNSLLAFVQWVGMVIVLAM